MNAQTVVLAAAVVGFFAQLIGIFLLIWRGGRVLGRMEEAMGSLAKEVVRLAQFFDKLEERVGHLEGRRA